MTTTTHPNPIDPGVRSGHVHLKVANLERAWQLDSDPQGPQRPCPEP